MNLLNQIEAIANNNDHSTVIFDLDDTLFRSSARTLFIINEFCYDQEYVEKFNKSIPQLQKLKLENISYYLEDTLHHAGIDDNELFLALKKFWGHRFFTGNYVQHDVVINGAASFVQSLVKLSIRVIYLTGRDHSMRAGTIEKLVSCGFPFEEDESLITKPKPYMDDFEFKKDALSLLKCNYTVVACFENEPKNLILMHNVFPNALMVFVRGSSTEKESVVLSLKNLIEIDHY